MSISDGQFIRVGAKVYIPSESGQSAKKYTGTFQVVAILDHLKRNEKDYLVKLAKITDKGKVSTSFTGQYLLPLQQLLRIAEKPPEVDAAGSLEQA